MLLGGDNFVIEEEHEGRCLYCGPLAIIFLFSMLQIERNLDFLLLDTQRHAINQPFQLQFAATVQQWWQEPLQGSSQSQQFWILHIY